MSYWIDTHAHIYMDAFKNDRADMIERSHEAGVQRIYMPNVDHTTIDDMLETETRWPSCIAMMGLHPCSVKKGFERELYVVEEWLNKRTFSAVGEIGTDLYWDKTFWDHQLEAFSIQIEWAKKFSLPVVIHCRESLDETIALLEERQDGKLRGIFHCFTGTVAQAEKITRLGFHVGIGGVATFKKGGLDVVLPDIPVDRIVLETDSPYLTPTPHRGKRNEPSYIPLIAEKVAGIKDVSTEALRDKTTANALEIFGANV